MSTGTDGNVSRVLKGVVIGGFFAILCLVALVTLFVAVSDDEGPNYLLAFLSATGVVVFSLATIRFTGFWDKWGMAAFFALAPVILVLDFTINPYFPAGTILAAGLFYGALRDEGKTKPE